MFKLFHCRQSNGGKAEPDVDSVLDIIAVMQGQINIQHVIISTIIDRLDRSQRDLLIASFKVALGQRFGGDPQWLNEKRKQVYNNTISATLMNLIASAEKDQPPQLD